eukprot:6212324-Pleurochrysis_carterae.AAC.1
MRASERLCAHVSVSGARRCARGHTRAGTRARGECVAAARVHVSTLVDWRAKGRESTARAGGSLIGRTRAREGAPGSASKRAPACAIAGAHKWACERTRDRRARGRARRPARGRERKR